MIGSFVRVMKGVVARTVGSVSPNCAEKSVWDCSWGWGYGLILGHDGMMDYTGYWYMLDYMGYWYRLALVG